MPEFLDTPEFQNEQEEATWWDSQEGRAVLLKGFQQAQQDGTLRRGTTWAKLRAAMPEERQRRLDERLKATLAPWIQRP